jgi:hypothetical protein
MNSRAEGVDLGSRHRSVTLGATAYALTLLRSGERGAHGELVVTETVVAHTKPGTVA